MTVVDFARHIISTSEYIDNAWYKYDEKTEVRVWKGSNGLIHATKYQVKDNVVDMSTAANILLTKR